MQNRRHLFGLALRIPLCLVDQTTVHDIGNVFHRKGGFRHIRRDHHSPSARIWLLQQRFVLLLLWKRRIQWTHIHRPGQLLVFLDRLTDVCHCLLNRSLASKKGQDVARLLFLIRHPFQKPDDFSGCCIGQDSSKFGHVIIGKTFALGTEKGFHIKLPLPLEFNETGAVATKVVYKQV